MSETSILTDMEGGANAGVISYNFECLAERFKLPDTWKAQQIARLTKGCVLYSDMGRILCSITEDTASWHDPLRGCPSGALVRAKYRDVSYQQFRNGFPKNARDSFPIELEKRGLGPRDFTANVNLFSRVTVDETGCMTSHPRNSMSPSHVELRAEMDVLALIGNCPQLNHPCDAYNPTPMEVLIWDGRDS
jgi:urea carboxylase-associated protein 2